MQGCYGKTKEWEGVKNEVELHCVCGRRPGTRFWTAHRGQTEKNESTLEKGGVLGKKYTVARGYNRVREWRRGKGKSERGKLLRDRTSGLGDEGYSVKI